MGAEGGIAVSIRPATQGDAAAAAGIQLASALAGFAHIFPDWVAKPQLANLVAEWSELLADRAKSVMVAELGGTVVGVVAFGSDDRYAPAGHAHLKKLYVRPESSSRGIGGALHDLAVDELRRAGHRAVWLWVLEENQRARSMYERRGWVAHSEERRTDWPDSGVYEIGYSLEL